MKSWSYKQITESVERSIRMHLKLAAADEHPGGKRAHELFAIGAYHAWKDLTAGWMEDGDSERLDKLARGESN